MESEFQILNNLKKNQYSTQRDIAKNTGLSLGNVNILIKRLVKKGLLKIERINARTIKYTLTPEGLKQKADATYRFVVSSVKYINEINSSIEALLNDELCRRADKIFLLGNRDEIGELIQNKLRHSKKAYELVGTLEELEKLVDNSDTNLLILWNPEFEELVRDKDWVYINLLELI